MPEIFRSKIRPVARPKAPTHEFVRLQTDAAIQRVAGPDEATLAATLTEASGRIAALDAARAARLHEIGHALGLPPITERRAPALEAAGDTVSISVERSDVKYWLFGAEVVRNLDGASSFFTLYTADAAAVFWVKCRSEGGAGVYLAEIHTDSPGVSAAIGVRGHSGANQSMFATPGTHCLRAVFDQPSTTGFDLSIRPQGSPLRIFRVDITRLS
ncbi:MAG: hypothetical protein IPK80_19300 [Nannocystis sp.]|nr:hypothetical protein [Nannocystis sp.]